MKYNIILIFFILFLSNNIYSQNNDINSNIFSNGKYTYTYEEHCYDGIGESVLTIDETDTGFIAVWKGINDTTTVFADKKYNTEKIIITDKDRHITVLRTGNTLKISGTASGEKIDKKLKIDSKRWFQIIPFSLIPFTKSDRKKVTFSLFDPYNLKIRNIVVKKKKTESTTVKGKKYSAVKMSMRLQGLLNPFWKSEIWNNTENGIYIKYEGLNVVPKLYKSKIYLKNAEYEQVLGNSSEKSVKKKS